MDHFAGLDVSVKETSVCIVDETGKIVREVKVASLLRVARLQVAKRNLCPPPSCFQGMSAIHFRRTDRDRFDPAHRRKLALPRRLVNQPSKTEH